MRGKTHHIFQVEDEYNHIRPVGRRYRRGERVIVIARIWKGWTEKQDADEYEGLLRGTVYPGFRSIPGYIDGYILRQEKENETEFVTINMFDSIEAVKAFAGEEYETPVFEPEARRLLSKVEQVARHYEVKKSPEVK